MQAHPGVRLGTGLNPRLDESLPIYQKRDEIVQAIRDNHAIIVCGETGSGKSTQLPLLCLEAGRGLHGVIGHTQPRRIAARTIAHRLAEELSVPLGREVGFKVRFTDKTDPATSIKVMTDGILLAEMQRDRRLQQYDTIIIDEAHERSLNIDFLLGLLRQLQRRRSDLHIVLTSATIDPQRFSEYFGGVPILEVSGRSYPVDVLYRPAGTTPTGLLESAAESVINAVAELAVCGPGDVLVFLPGEREIREASNALKSSPIPSICKAEILPLYARLPAKEQILAFRPHERRRIILATNIAETSVTVPGVHYVVDSGVARVSRYSSRSRVQGLEIEPISQAAANQRAGRCGRVADGVCIRLYSENEYNDRPPSTEPEILRSNLAGVVLRMKALDLGDPRKFPFLDPPSNRRIRDAYDTLIEIGALDADYNLTPIGNELSTLPIDPRLGRIILASNQENALREVLIIVAALSTRDPRERPHDARGEADKAHRQFADARSDFMTFLNIWDAYREKEQILSTRKLNRWCSESFLSWRGLREWGDLYRQLSRLVCERRYTRNTTPASEDAIHRSVLAGYLSNIGKRGERHEYTGTLGTEFYIHPGSVLFPHKPRWVVAAEMVRTGRVYARMVAPVRNEWIVSFGKHLLEPSYDTPAWDHRKAAPVVMERVALLGLPLSVKRRVVYGRINPVHARELFIRHGLVDGAFRPHADFIFHNDTILHEVRRLGAKARREARESQAGARHDFFDRVLPPDVWSGKRFEHWRHKAEAKDPYLLYMQHDDIIDWTEEIPTSTAYPDSVTINGRDQKLEYQHNPGGHDDGVNLTLTLSAFHALTEADHDWLVPGLVRERVLEMLRGLPKSLRRGIGPAPEIADAYLRSEPNRSMTLAETLADFVGRTCGVAVQASDFRGVEISPHLIPLITVTDDAGSVLMSSRDIHTLRRDVSDEVESVLRQHHPGRHKYDHARRWIFDTLPEAIKVATASGEIIAYPALVDNGNTVSYREYPDPDIALYQHHLGVRRLLAIHHRRKLRRTLSSWPALGRMKLTYAALGLSSPLDDEIMLVTVGCAAAKYLAEVRSEQSFTALCDSIEEHLESNLVSTLDLLDTVLASVRYLMITLDDHVSLSWRASYEDVREQVRYLLPDQPFSSREWRRIRCLPRYLNAAKQRLHKLAGGHLERDTHRMQVLEPRWRRWVELDAALSDLSKTSPVRVHMERYRWMLEEYRVSLFAQEMGTAERISAPRIDACWQKIREALQEDAAASSLHAVCKGTIRYEQ